MGEMDIIEWDIESCVGFSVALTRSDADVAWQEALQLLSRFGVHTVDQDEDTSADALTIIGGALQERLSIPRLLGQKTRRFIQGQLNLALERRSNQAERLRLEERIDLLSQGSFEGILIHESGVVIEVNERLSEILGYSTQELLGPLVMSRCLAQEDLDFVMDKMRSGYEGAYLATGIRKDGSRFRVELQAKQGHLGSRPVRVVAVRDVTERERMVTLLRESEQRLSDLANTVFDLTVMSRRGVMLSAQGPLLAALGYTPTEFLSKKVVDLVAPSGLAVVERHLGTGTTGAYESVMISKDGEHVPIEIVAVQSTLDGVPTRIAGIRDLRKHRNLELERQELQRRIERAQRLDSLGVLAGGIAHDFNNLLMSVLGNAELLRISLQPSQDEHIEGILSAAHQAAELTARMLAYAGKGEVGPPELLDLDGLLQQLAVVLARRKDNHCTFELDLATDTQVRADRAALTQVFMNLMTNAADSIDKGGRVVVKSCTIERPDRRWEQALGAVVGPGKWVLVEVIDNGRGMDPAIKDRIFEPFFTTKDAGHGLGLASCLGIVESHGGAIHVSSRPGIGSRFSVLLPYGEAMTSGKRPASDVEPCRVLIVDDEAIIRRQMERSLRLRGFSVSEADGGVACLAAVDHEQPDVILLDMGMPDMPGADVVAELRRRGKDVPVVLTSGYFDGALERYLEPGSFQAFLRKPYGVAEMVEAIDTARRKSPAPRPPDQ